MVHWILAVVTVAVGVALFYDWDTFDPESIRGKRVLITGASSGIGEELAYQYSKLGASVVITARRAEQLHKVALKCKELGANKVEYVAADMSNAKDRIKVVSDTERHFGGHLDHLILDHAIFDVGYWLGSAENMTLLQKVLETNFVSFADIASKTLPMLTKTKGNIGIVASYEGKVASPTVLPYASSKFAVRGFFSSLRQELKHRNTGVSVTVTILGYIGTDVALDVFATKFKNAPLFTPAPVEDTALTILKSVTKRAYEVYYPSYIKFLLILHKVFPDYFEDYFGSVAVANVA